MARKTRSAPAPSARNSDHTDREFLANINAALGPDGWATSTEIARECGFTGNGDKRTPAVKVASRLAWMRAGGLLDSTNPDLTVPYREPGDRDTRWRLTTLGQQILGGKLSKAVTNALGRMDPGDQILLMGELTKIGYIDANDGMAFALRRQIQHDIAQRKLVVVNRRTK